MVQNILFDPLLPLPILFAATGLAVLILLFSAWQRLSGWLIRGVGASLILLTLANPSLQQEERETLNDIVLVLVDDSASQGIGGRPDQSEAALADLRRKTETRQNTDLQVVRLGDADDDRGTLISGAITRALADIPENRIAGIVIISDGVAHDVTNATGPPVSAPMHLLQTGRSTDRDRRLTVKTAPGFAIMGEAITLTLRIDDLAATPGANTDTSAPLSIAVDGEDPVTLNVPIGRDFTLPFTLPHGGMNTLQFSTPTESWELTDRNNQAILRINGVRDRLRVLLVSGEPHAGERVWRNLLKSDSTVDLVHFTILRPPGKQDSVPTSELALIAFPTRELFIEKIDEFDLIIFDRYKRRGILPGTYYDAMRDYVLNGGAVLVAAGPDYASVDSLWYSALSDILPGGPTGQVIERGYHPEVSDLGRRHPVTRGLDLGSDDNAPPWGRWLRLTELTAKDDAQIVMTGLDTPLLMLDRAGEGRVALLGSDQSWLWARGYEGGGPQGELLRRLAHWMMKEPDLEEERLTASPRGQSMQITHQSLSDTVENVEITAPSGDVITLPLTENAPGQFTQDWDAPEPGLYHLKSGDAEAVVALGPAAPREFVDTIATPDILAPLIRVTKGGSFRVETGLPDLRTTRAGRPAAGRNWIGLHERGATRTLDITRQPVLPRWAWLFLILSTICAAWLYEGRRV